MDSPPVIPDHDVLRMIGSGAFGEIWLARGRTGALRAVKIVYRSTFDDERSFQREFDGMSGFEPFSREHPGFVDVLHVGRDVNDAFFYYIMELADDVSAGADQENIDWNGYTPRTLRSDLEKQHRLPTKQIVELGASIAGALGELHDNGLTHRDIKPANIIFVEGRPKIADIGLVAATGQQTFVGTEGYVPPEGPGTPAADLYSLGKVLYELATGRDRLDFPELPEDIERFPDKKTLLELNPILLKACARDANRRYASAFEMEADLREIIAPAQKKSSTGIVIACILAAASIGIVRIVFSPDNAPGTPVDIEVTASPKGATVILDTTVLTSPARFRNIEPGTHNLHVMREGFGPVDRRITVAGGKNIKITDITLQRSHGSIEIRTQPAGGRISLDGPIEPAGLEKPVRHDSPEPLVLKNLPAGTYRVTAHLATSSLEQVVNVTSGEPLSIVLRFAKGSAKITSAPSGATVIRDGLEIGETPLLIEDLTPGIVHFVLRKPGFRDTTIEGKINASTQSFLAVRLEKHGRTEPGKPFNNSLGMKFVPLGDIWIAITETEVGSYQQYAKTTDTAGTPQEGMSANPVTNVNWEEAMAFCRWLTDRERSAGFIGNNFEYRLPADAEWSLAALMPDEGGDTPEIRDGRLKNLFPWGKAWPPPYDAGNFGGTVDGFERTAPVACFSPNALGLYDLGGNVWEWCLDSYNAGNRDWGVLRGGSYTSKKRTELLASYRNVIDRTEHDPTYGFRCVLAPVNTK